MTNLQTVYTSALIHDVLKFYELSDCIDSMFAKSFIRYWSAPDLTTYYIGFTITYHLTIGD
jgi:hypothetical protein